MRGNGRNRSRAVNGRRRTQLITIANKPAKATMIAAAIDAMDMARNTHAMVKTPSSARSDTWWRPPCDVFERLTDITGSDQRDRTAVAAGCDIKRLCLGVILPRDAVEDKSVGGRA